MAYLTTIDLSLYYLLFNQLRALQQSGYEVIGISSPGPEVSVIEAAGIRHIGVPMTRRANTPFADLSALWRLYSIFRSNLFTIVHTHTPKAGILGRWAAKLAGVPIIVHTSHGLIFHDRLHPLVRYFFITLEKIAAQCSDLIFSVNQEDIETGIRESIWPPQKIKYIGNGIDVERFNPANLLSGEILPKRLELGLRVDTPVVGFVGRLVKEKGLLDLFKAARIVRERVPGVRFVIVGPEDTEKPDALTPSSATEYGVADICCFTGMRQDMPELYLLMDVFALPSHREGFPLAPLEASAMKVPCVVTNIRGCREAVEHGKNGLLVPLGDVQALANSIIELLTDKEKARRMGEEGRHMAVQRFDESLVFEKVKAEYTRLLREKGFPVPEPLTK
jgi:glycosyltransferase involved in cell wall biosynthesis